MDEDLEVDVTNAEADATVSLVKATWVDMTMGNSDDLEMGFAEQSERSSPCRYWKSTAVMMLLLGVCVAVIVLVFMYNRDDYYKDMQHRIYTGRAVIARTDKPTVRTYTKLKGIF